MGNEQNNQPPHHPQAERFAMLFKDAIIADPDSMSPLQENLVNFVGEFTDKVCRHFGFDIMDGELTNLDTEDYDHHGCIYLLDSNDNAGASKPIVKMGLNNELVQNSAWNLESQTSEDQTESLKNVVQILITIAHEFAHYRDIYEYPDRFNESSVSKYDPDEYYHDPGEIIATEESLELVTDEVIDKIVDKLNLKMAKVESVKNYLKDYRIKTEDRKKNSFPWINPLEGLFVSELADRDQNG